MIKAQFRLFLPSSSFSRQASCLINHLLEFASHLLQANYDIRTIQELLGRLLNLSETVPATFSTFALFSKVLEVTCTGGKSWMKVV